MGIRKHPIFSGILIGLSFIVILCLADYLAGIVLHKKPLVERYIRLRESYPNTDYRQAVQPAILKYADGLETRIFRLRTDENGFIVPSIRHAQPDLTIIFMGGSTTECTFVDEENRFPYLVGKLLEAREGIKINSVNAGVSANNSMHTVDLLLNKIIPLKPDIVVFHESMNDLLTLLLEGTYWNTSPRQSLIMDAPKLDGTSLLKFVRYSLLRNFCDIIFSWSPLESMFAYFRHNNFGESYNPKIKQVVIDEARLVREYRKALELEIAICRIRGFKPVLMTEANRVTDNPASVVRDYLGILNKKYGVGYAEFKKVYDLFNECIREVGAKHGVVVIDLDRRIPKEKDYLYDLVHYNDRGSRLAAEVIVDGLETSGILKK